MTELKGESPTTRIGSCTFRQLPEKYQELFRTGANQISEGRFVAEKYPASAMLGLPFLWLFASLPAIPVTNGGLSLQALGFLRFIPLILMAGLTLVRIRQLVEMFQAWRAGARLYGLVIDEHNLVSRRFHLLPVKSCVFIPRSRIQSLPFQKSRGHPSKYGTPSALWVRFEDEQGRDIRLKLTEGNSLELRPQRLKDLLLAANRGLQGQWSLGDPAFKRSVETRLQFDESQGRLLEFHDGKQVAEIEFRYRQTGYSEISIDPADDTADLQGGQYRYEVATTSSNRQTHYTLSFDRDIGGMRGRWFGPLLDADWQSSATRSPVHKSERDDAETSP